MAKRPGTDDGNVLTMDSGDEAEEISLKEILSLYSQPINEEQAWAVCYQCCRTLAQRHRRKSPKSAVASAAGWPRRIEGPGNVRIRRDGTVELRFGDGAGKRTEPRGQVSVIYPDTRAE